MTIRAAVVLGGCGRSDGSEIHESVSCLVHLARHAVTYQCFAPDRPQAEVINHATNQVMDGSRNLMIEAARISRGDITPLDQLEAGAFDGVVFPGGSGAAKNLFTFAIDGVNCRVFPDVERVVKAFHDARKPIALCCIAPVIAARVLGTAHGGPGVEVTLGVDRGVADAVESWGATHIVKPVRGAHVDETRRVITSPAYMYAKATAYEVFEGIGAMIDAFVAQVQRDRHA